MKRSLSFLILCSLCLHAEKNTVASQFLKLLVPTESAAEKVPTQSQSKPESIIEKEPELDNHDQNLKNRFLELLAINKKTHQKKLYRDDLGSLHFRYITELEYNHGEEFPQLDEKKLTKAEKDAAKKYGTLIAQGYEAPWYLCHISDQIGHGAFADANIKEGEMIAEYTGIVIQMKNSNDIDASYAWTLIAPEYCRNEGLFFQVNAKKAGNFTRFINHSSYPNVQGHMIYCDGAWHLVYVAAKNIKKDEQLLVNYGAGYWIRKTCQPVEMGL